MAHESRFWELEGALFFGNADDLAAELRELAVTNEVVLLDTRRVSDVDASGIAALEQVAQRFEDKGKALIACGPNLKVSKLFWWALGKRDDVLFLDRDTALEWAEERIIGAQTQEHEVLDMALHDADLTQRMSLHEHIRALAEKPPTCALCLGCCPIMPEPGIRAIACRFSSVEA